MEDAAAMATAEAAVAAAIQALRKVSRSRSVRSDDDDHGSCRLHPLPPSQDVVAPPKPILSLAMEEKTAQALNSLGVAMKAIKRMRRSRDPRVDFISRLPDDVLGTILSLIPTKDGARSQIISRRWLPLWRSSPLNLVASVDLCRDLDKRVDLVDRILSEHPGPARCFSLLGVNHDLYISENKMDVWLRSQALSNLEELKLRYIEAYPLPPSVFRFAPTLRSAEFVRCHFSDHAPSSLNFPHLKQLTLHYVGIFEDLLNIILSACTALESLSLHQIMGVAQLCISSRTLRSFSFYNRNSAKDTSISLEQLVIQEAPCLERLLPRGPDQGPTFINVINAPKLAVIGSLSQGIYMLQFGATFFQEMSAVSLETKMHSVRVLALQSIGPNLESVIGFLKCFPCLETLHVTASLSKDMNNAQNYDPLESIECLELHLKKVVLKNCDGSKRPVVGFAKFFILNAKVLEEMQIEIINHRNDKWMDNLRRQLKVEYRASQDARIELKKDVQKSLIHNAHMHDLSIVDPFDSSSCRCIDCMSS